MAAAPALERIRRDRTDAPKRIQPLLEYLEQHLFDPSLNVNQLKAACGIRDNSIVIHFHSQIGQTPKAYISARRLETAARLLQGTDLRVWKISELVGYSGLGVFSKAFNRWAGQRPLSFRRRAKSSNRLADLPIQLPGSNDDFLRQAIIGELEPGEVDRLIDHLRQLY